jgi:hypothetical protein
MQALVQLGLARARAAGAAAGAPIVVGYAMKPSREQQLADQGLLPLVPQPAEACTRGEGAKGGPGAGAGCHSSRGVAQLVVFMPLDLGRPLGEQGHVDAVLHKASDELVSAGGGGGGGDGGGGQDGGGGGGDGSSGGGGVPRWSPAMEALKQQLAAAPRVCVVDPFDAAAKVGWAWGRGTRRSQAWPRRAALSTGCWGRPKTRSPSFTGRGPRRAVPRAGGSCGAAAAVRCPRARTTPPGCRLPRGAGPARPAGGGRWGRKGEEGDDACMNAACSRWPRPPAFPRPSPNAPPPGLARGPLLVKPIVACGLPESHAMALALDAAALPLLAAAGAAGGEGGAAPGAAASGVGGGPIVVQEFCNHGGLQYKVYAIGDQVCVCGGGGGGRGGGAQRGPGGGGWSGSVAPWGAAWRWPDCAPRGRRMRS